MIVVILFFACYFGCRFLSRLKILLLFLSFFNLAYSRWTSSLPSCLWSLRIFPSLPGSRLTIFYRDASSALLQLVNQWLNFTYLRSHAFRYERKNTNPTLVNRTHDFRTSRCTGYLLDHSGDEARYSISNISKYPDMRPLFFQDDFERGSEK